MAEAATRPTMRFVELKSETQLDMQTLRRARDRLVGERTALINPLRAILLERGPSVPQGRHKLGQYLAACCRGVQVAYTPERASRHAGGPRPDEVDQLELVIEKLGED